MGKKGRKIGSKKTDNSDNRLHDEFNLFLKEAEERINKFREQWRIDPEKVSQELRGLVKMQKQLLGNYSDEEDIIKNVIKGKIFKIVRSKRYKKLDERMKILLCQCRPEYVEDILKEFNRPLSWRELLRWYILTEETILPSAQCKMYTNNGKVIMEIPPEVNVETYKRAFKSQKTFSVSELQASLSGGSIRKKRRKKNLNKKLGIAKDQVQYRMKRVIPKQEYEWSEAKKVTIGKSEIKKRRREMLIKKHNPDALNNEKAQEREDARQRQIHKRYKKYIHT